MVINYVTGNKGKVDLANLIYKDYDIEIIQKDIDTPEIQDINPSEVAKYSAKYAADLLGVPVLKNDSGLVIEELNGFPGAFAKYAEETIKAEGFIKLLDGVENRRAYWIESLAFAYPGSEPVVFTSYSYGTISTNVREGRGYDYDKIFIPDKDTRTFSEMSELEQLSFFDNKAYIELYEYLKDRLDENN